MEDTRNAMFALSDISHRYLNFFDGYYKCIKKGDFSNGRHRIICAIVSCEHVSCLIQSSQVLCPSFEQSVCFPPSLLGSTGGAALALGRVDSHRRGGVGGHTRGEYLGFLGTSVKDFSS